MRNFIAFALLLFTLSISPVYSQDHGNNAVSKFDIPTSQWQSDLAFLKDHAPLFHKDLFNKMSRSEYESYISALNTEIPSLTSNQIYARLMKLVTMFGDGHTVMQASTAEFYPVRFHIFSDGIFIIDADNKSLIGKKLESIEGINVKELYEKLIPYVARDNEWQVKTMMPLYMVNARLLNGIGVADSDKEISIELTDKSGNKISETFSPVSHSDFRKYMPYSYAGISDPPLYLQNTDKNYWFEYLPESKTLYFKYNVVLSDNNESVSKFIKRMSGVVEQNEIEKFIIDVRNNGGGNNFTSVGFIDYISNNPDINQRGKLFLLIDRKTFSAASFFTSGIENMTEAIIVGEPTGATPNHYGDAAALTLPNSGLTVRLSTILWQNSFPWDSRVSTVPDIMVELSSDDYFNGKDPVLEKVLQYNYDPGNVYDLTPGELKIISGRYRYPGDEVLEIYDDNGKPAMRITDGLGSTFTDFIKTRLYPVSEKVFPTSIRGVEIGLDLLKGSYIILKTNGKELRLERDDDYKIPAELLSEGNYSEAVEIYKKLKVEGSNRKSLNEIVINQLGYSLIGKKNYDAAITYFKVNVELYPNSANAYDSLGEAYMLSGNNTLALENYRRAFELDPQNENASDMIKKLSSLN